MNTELLKEKNLGIYNFPIFFQFSRKIYIVYTNGQKYGKILKSYPLAKWKSMGIPVLSHSCVHLTTPFWLKISPEKLSSFPRKFTLCAKMAKN